MAYLTASDGDRGNRLIVNTEMATLAGETYEAEITFDDPDAADVGIAFAVQPTTTGWSDFTGYLAFVHTGRGEIRLDRWANGSQIESVREPVSLTAGQPLTATIGFRDPEDVLTFKLADGPHSASEATLDDDTHDWGLLGFYRFHYGPNWRISHVTLVEEEEPEPKTAHELLLEAAAKIVSVGPD